MWFLSRKQKQALQFVGLMITLILLFSGYKLPQQTHIVQSTPTPTPQGGVVAGTTQIATDSASMSTALVTKVIDGDTLEVSISGQLKKLRMIGIDTPETVDPRRPVECFGKEASAKTKELLQGKEVRLEKDVSETDKYGRLLRYIYVGDSFINEQLVAEGYAEASAYPPDIAHQAQLELAEKQAQELRKGLWAPDNCPIN
jgi:micrococcal nuclease